MIFSWLFYAVWVGTLLGLGAWAAERALRLAGRPARLVWLVAMTLSVLIPGSIYAIRTWMPETTLGLPSVGLSEFVLPALWLSGDAAVASASVSQRVTDLVLFGIWAVVSSGLLALLVHSQWRLHRERAGWIHTRVDGVPVLVSRHIGPATIGSLRPRVVLPEWAVGLPAARRDMILRHELEHVRARDGLVALVGFATAALTPWNPAMWWMLSRLRLAQEMDCDRRLLSAGIPMRSYVDLLLTAGQPALHASLAAPGLSFSHSTLRKRIVQMTHIPQRSSRIQATAIGAVAIGLGLLACDTPVPDGADGLTGPATAVVGVDGDLAFGPDAALHTDNSENTWTSGDLTLDLSLADHDVKDMHLRVEDNEWVYDDDVATARRVLERMKERKEQAHIIEFAPDADASLLPRVKREPGADESPALLILDGEIWEGSKEALKRLLSERQAGDVELLSGREAVARFGPRAANGAILLETDGN